MPEVLWTLDAVELAGAERPRLQGVALQIRPGITGVVGPSGAGKTSLLNLLVEFERPTAGSVRFVPLADEGSDRAPLYWCPADAGLWPHLSVREHLTAVAPATGSDPGAEIDRLLSAFDLGELERARPHRLSAGQRDRIGLARAIATHARVLVLDEPLVHVDSSAARAYWDTLRAHVLNAGVSLVVASHDPATILAECDQVICLDRGRVTYRGDVDTLNEQPESEELARYLGDVNWVSPERARVWLGLELANGRAACYRPHRLDVVPTPDAPFVVTSSINRGPTSEVRLMDERTGATARFVHRSPPRPLEAGMRVVMRICAALALLSVLGCGGDREGDAGAPVRHVRHLPMPPCDARVPAPRAVAPGRDGEWLVLDTAGRVLVLGPDGGLRRHWFMPAHDIGKPEGICLLRDGRIAVADTHYHRVTFFDAEGNVVAMLGSQGDGPGQFRYPVRLAQDDTGHLYVAEYGGNDRVQKFTAAGEFVLAFGRCGTGHGELERPSGVQWRAGLVYVSDAMNHRLHVFGDDGTYRGLLAGRDADSRVELSYPYDVAVDPAGHLYVVGYGDGRVTVLGSDARLLSRFGSAGNGPRELATPWAVGVNSAGRVLIADTGNRRLVEVEVAL